MSQLIAFLTALFTFITSILFSGLPTQSKDYDVYNNVAYGTGDREVMDIYIPHTAENFEENGCVLYIHGGSWTSGDKGDRASECKKTVKRGYITATMNYMLFICKKYIHLIT